MPGYSGNEQFVWWQGVVEDRIDPLQLGRVRVRIYGFHSPLKKDIPTEDLPWAIVMMPVTSACNSGVGTTPTGLTEGSWVVGFFRDDELGQQPIVIGSLPGLIEATKPGSMNDEFQENFVKAWYLERFGDGFRDARTDEQLQNAPVAYFEKRQYPDGKTAEGDKHGAQLIPGKPERFPRKKAHGKINLPAENSLSDVSIVATNDKDFIDDTIIGLKRKGRSKGGLLEENVPIADIPLEPFTCGCTGESGVGLLGGQAISVKPIPSTLSNYKANKEKPTNSNGDKVYNG